MEIVEITNANIETMEGTRFALPPATNWFCPHIIDVSQENIVAYGSRNNLVFLKFAIEGKELFFSRVQFNVSVKKKEKKNVFDFRTGFGRIQKQLAHKIKLAKTSGLFIHSLIWRKV